MDLRTKKRQKFIEMVVAANIVGDKVFIFMNGSKESEVYLILRSGDNRSTTSIHECVIFPHVQFPKEVHQYTDSILEREQLLRCHRMTTTATITVD
jgi:hypothetical protein